MKRIPAVKWGLTKSPIEMRKLKHSAGTSVIPKGCYCYDEENCPYWDRSSKHNEQDNGYCWYLEEGDWQERSAGLLWDQCKICGINDDDDSLYELKEGEEEETDGTK